MLGWDVVEPPEFGVSVPLRTRVSGRGVDGSGADTTGVDTSPVSLSLIPTSRFREALGGTEWVGLRVPPRFDPIPFQEWFVFRPRPAPVQDLQLSLR